MSRWRAVTGYVSLSGMGPTVRGLVFLLFASGCDSSAGPQTGSSPSEPVALASAGVRAAARYTEDAFTVELSGPSSVAVGERASFVVTLRAGTAYKVNAEYPHKFKTKEQSGITFKQKVIDRTLANIAKDVATFPVEVVATAPGPRKVAGQLAFSVCTAEKCLIERRDLEFGTEAK